MTALRNTILADQWLFAKGNHDAPSESFRPVRLPHDWAMDGAVQENIPNGESQGFFNERGTGWYRRPLSIRKEAGYRYQLNFDGVMENSTVWVNSREVGGHGWGYTPFRLDITDALQNGENEILLRCDCSCTPPDRWYSGCGLYRPVTLICVPEIHLDERNVVLHTDVCRESASVRISTGVTVPVKAELMLNGALAASAGGTDTVLLEVPHPALWSAETPVLYTLTLTLADGSDSISMKVGFRRYSWGINGITINDRPVYLRGVCVHQDIACVGIAATKDLWRQRLAWLKEIGVNAIRGAHHVHSADFMDLCDEMGFYVYEEFTDKWHSGSYNRYFQDWQEDVDAMIRRDRNRPSVLIWGCGNEVENQAQPSMLETLKMLTDYIRSQDPARPVSYAMNPHFKRRSGIDASKVADIQKLVDEADEYEIEDLTERVECISRIAQYVDILSCNYQEQWFDAIHRANPDKPILATEVYQFFIGAEKCMQNYSMNDLPVAFGEKYPWCLGSFIWAGFDYLGESHGWPAKGSSGAVIRSNGVPRMTVHILRALWNTEPYIHIGILDYSFPDEMTKEHWTVPPYEDGWDFKNVGRQVFPFLIATNCQEVTVEYADRKLWYSVPAQGPSGYISGFVPFVPGKIRVTGYRDGSAVCSHELRTPGPAALLRFTDAPESLPAKKDYMRLLRVQAEDHENIHVIRALNETAFSVTGPAEIIAVDNGDMMNRRPFADRSIPLYRGTASVLIRLTGESGQVTVTASADGLQSGCAQLSIG